mgnify:CR=1 FL=1
MLKNEAVNEKLKELNAPFVLKMGVLGDFHFKFSILTQRLEKIYINNLILFVQTKFQQDSEYFRLSAEEQKVGISRRKSPRTSRFSRAWPGTPKASSSTRCRRSLDETCPNRRPPQTRDLRATRRPRISTTRPVRRRPRRRKTPRTTSGHTPI